MPGTVPGTKCAFLNHQPGAPAVTVTLLLFYMLSLALLLQKSLQPGRDDVLIQGQRLLLMYAPKVKSELAPTPIWGTENLVMMVYRNFASRKLQRIGLKGPSSPSQWVMGLGVQPQLPGFKTHHLSRSFLKNHFLSEWQITHTRCSASLSTVLSYYRVRNDTNKICPEKKKKKKSSPANQENERNLGNTWSLTPATAKHTDKKHCQPYYF